MSFGVGLPITFCIGIILTGVLCFNNLERCCYIVIFSSVFMGVAFLHIGGNSVLVYHVCSMVLFLKFLHYVIKQKDVILIKGEKINSMFFFLIYCFFSIFVVLFKEPVEISVVDPGFGLSHFSFQQFTQYMYLLHAYIMMYMVYWLLNSGFISKDKLWNCIDCMYLVVVIIGFVQLFIPTELYNMILKNDANGTVHQFTTFGNIKIIRIDSTFGEASFLALFLVPLLCGYIFDAVHKITAKNFLFIVCGISIEMLNQSSTFIIGMAAFVIGIIIIGIIKKFADKQQTNMNKNGLYRNIIVGLVVVLICFLLKDFIKKDINTFISKLSMQHSSGTDRISSMIMALQVFKKNPILGIGFGTMRSLDLLSNWLAQLGIVGMFLYLIPVFILLIRLLIRRTTEGNKLFLLIVVSNAIMFAAVPEFRYLFIWLYYAMAFYCVKMELNYKMV